MHERAMRFRMPGRDVIGPVFLIGLLFAGYVKGTAAFAWLPVDLTTVAAAVTVLVVVLAFLRRLSAPRNAALVVLLWLSFVPASLFHGPASPFHDANPYAGEKVLKLWTLTLLAALAPFFVVDTPRRRMVSAWTVVGFGLTCTATAILFPDPLQSWRLVAEGSNTIAIGRAAGAACLVLAILGFFVRRRSLRVVLFVGALGMAAAVVESGSRGPLFAAAVAFLLVGCSRLDGTSSRRARIVAVLAMFPFALWWMSRDAGLAAERILRVVQGGAGDDVSVGARLHLIGGALRTAGQHPAGVGWGSLVDYLRPSEVLDDRWTQYPHNLLVEVLAEAGVVCALAVVAFLAVSAWRLRRCCRSRDGAIWSGLTLFFVLNAMVSGDINDNRPMFAAVAITLTIEVARRREVRSGPPVWPREGHTPADADVTPSASGAGRPAPGAGTETPARPGVIPAARRAS
ncbi:O-antigen ligase family protein [Actinopolymorpha pittospori]